MNSEGNGAFPGIVSNTSPLLCLSFAGFPQPLPSTKRAIAYVTGGTDDAAQRFPTTPGAFQTKGGLTFVSKLNPTGSTLVYSSLLGASTGYYEDSVREIQVATGIAVDRPGNVFLSGYTSTADLPTTSNAPFPKRPGGGHDAFVMKVNASGTGLVYSTFLGGKNSEIASAIAIDAAGRAYVTGWTRSSDFPVTASNVQSTLNPGTCGSSPAPSTCPDAFITRLAPDGSAIEYSTYLGGSGLDEGNGVAVNIRRTVAVAGFTNSTDFPTANARQSVSGDEVGMPHGLYGELLIREHFLVFRMLGLCRSRSSTQRPLPSPPPTAWRRRGTFTRARCSPTGPCWWWAGTGRRALWRAPKIYNPATRTFGVG